MLMLRGLNLERPEDIAFAVTCHPQSDKHDFALFCCLTSGSEQTFQHRLSQLAFIRDGFILTLGADSYVPYGK